MTKDEFIETVAALCEPLALSIPNSCTIAQAALESGYGASGLSQKANNLFGIKAGSTWKGSTYSCLTKEVVNGTTITQTAIFRKYESWGLSIIDHDDFLRNNARYAKVLQAETGEAASDALQAAGYATDPNYAAKLKNIIALYDLHRFDAAQQPAPYTKNVEILARPGENITITVRVTQN